MAAKAWTFFDGAWHEGNPPIVGPMDHAMWLASTVFDGARAFDGAAPDLDKHSQRVINSATSIGLGPTKTLEEILALSKEGIAKFPSDAALYVRPMFWATGGFVSPDPATTQFALSVYASPLPTDKGYSACLSQKKRPGPDVAPTFAKAACLYPQSGLALQEARARGFDNAIMCDTAGHVSELATANIMIARDGVLVTPAPNGTFLNGITRQRVIQLMRDAGVEVQERDMTPDEVLAADEVFSTGNYGKLLYFSRVEERDFQPGPVYKKARDLYFDWARSGGI